MVYQTIITNKRIIDWNNLVKHLKDEGVLWIISEDIYQGGICDPTTFKLIEEGIHNGLILKNIILWINKFDDISDLIVSNHKNILLFAKSENYFFNKDPIRERHIWKDVEWGKRKKNYNPKGKDPGNVWILTKDDGKGKIVQFIPLKLEEVIERCVLCSSNKNDKILVDVKGVK